MCGSPAFQCSGAGPFAVRHASRSIARSTRHTSRCRAAQRTADATASTTAATHCRHRHEQHHPRIARPGRHADEARCQPKHVTHTHQAGRLAACVVDAVDRRPVGQGQHARAAVRGGDQADLVPAARGHLPSEDGELAVGAVGRARPQPESINCCRVGLAPFGSQQSPIRPRSQRQRQPEPARTQDFSVSLAGSMQPNLDLASRTLSSIHQGLHRRCA